MNNFNDPFNRNNFIYRDQRFGNLINNDPLGLNRFNSPLDPYRFRNPLYPNPGQPGPLGPLGKPTGRW